MTLGVSIKGQQCIPIIAAAESSAEPGHPHRPPILAPFTECGLLLPNSSACFVFHLSLFHSCRGNCSKAMKSPWPSISLLPSFSNHAGMLQHSWGTRGKWDQGRKKWSAAVSCPVPIWRIMLKMSSTLSRSLECFHIKMKVKENLLVVTPTV